MNRGLRVADETRGPVETILRRAASRWVLWVGVRRWPGYLSGMKHQHAVASHFAGTWEEARVQRWAEGVRARLDATVVSLGMIFMTPDYFDVAAEVLEVIRLHARVPLLVGCSSQSLIANAEELENQPGLVLQLFHLPAGEVKAVHLTQAAIDDPEAPGDWHARTGVGPANTRGWLIFADPFNMDGESWLREWNAAYPGIPAVGGLASGVFEEQRTQVYLNGDVFEEGIIAVSLGGGVRLECVISQGCTPIGMPWTVTRVDRNLILEIANRPAYHVLVETFNGLTDAEKEKAQGNLFVGFASSEYRDEFRRGDFLVRNLLGADPGNGVIAVGALPRPGQTIQFHRRDAGSATDDLAACLSAARERLSGETVYGGVVGICNGRGGRLFGKPNHDAGLIQEQLGPLPLSGFFCNGELGPVGKGNFLHGYTASLGLLVRAGDR
jgi:small ligand-binding sensory domain FIST